MKKILVVDDNQSWLNTIGMILEGGYDLTLLTNYAQAIKLLKSTDFDLVILDKQLPSISGLEVLKEMRKIKPSLRAIMLTGYADIGSAVESMKIGALDYIEKGTKELETELRSRVEEALGRRLPSETDLHDMTALDERGIAALIVKGESAELEFKSSARWDMRFGKINKELERVIVKTVAAFMNSEKGGILLIGIDDGGTIVGLQFDYKTLGKKQDRDVYENFLMTLLLDAYGKECTPLIHVKFHRISDLEICQITVKPSPKPMFVKDDKGEHLFIRAGNSTRILSTKEAIEYCKIRWKSFL